jgi:O-antigen/teichoic acid export membrane protein
MTTPPPDPSRPRLRAAAAMRRADFAWGGLAQLLNLGAGLLILPLVLRRFSSADVGLWFAFMSLTGLAQLLELGFQPSIARAAAYVHAGAAGLLAEGLHADGAPAGDVRLDLLFDLEQAARTVYRRVACVAAVALLAVATPYVYLLAKGHTDPGQAVAAWLLTAAGCVLNFYFGYYNALLQGRGDVTASNKVIVNSKLAFIVLGVGLLLAGTGLIGLGLASVASTVVGRVLARRFHRAGAVPFVPGHDPHAPARRRAILRDLWPNARRLGLTNLGAFLILRANTLVAASFLGLQAAASYGLAVQLFQALLAIAAMPMLLHMPQLHRAQVERNAQALRELMGLALVTATTLYVLGALVVCTLGPWLLALVGSHTHLPAAAATALLALVIGLELHHGLFASLITSFNRVPFVHAAIVSGVAVLALSLLAVTTTSWGIAGLVATQGLVQLAYNNWKWPLEGLRELATGWGALLLLGAVRAGRVLRGR